MPKEVFVIFPVHLFENISLLKNYKCYLVEEPVYFDRLSFNILKPIYHRATMKRYYDYLISKNIDVIYIEYHTSWLKKIKAKKFYCYDPVDKTIDKKLKYAEIFDTPGFLTSYDDLEDYATNININKQTSFYIWQRKKMNIFVKDSKPLHGKWTFDVENRSKLPQTELKNFSKPKGNKSQYIVSAINYCKKHFDDYGYYGHDDPQIIFPIDHLGAKKAFSDFLKNKLKKFGKYQDAFLKEDFTSLYHSAISPMLNIGLLTPKYVINEILSYYAKHKSIDYNNVEGFIRQIIGWREFCRYTYEFKSELFLHKNYFHNNVKLDSSWYKGTTPFPPVNNCIIKAFKYGYLHHIERLMIMANSMVLLRIHPDQMYNWFMEFSLDSYDWVMAYNVYAMGSYSDGGNFTTKPYISSSNYILKMSNYPKDKEWTDLFDDKFWNFLYIHREKIKKIPRLSMLLKFAKSKK